MQIVRPEANIVAFYDGRIAGKRLHADKPNWLDDAAFALGTCTYAIVDGADALVYDTHISLHHARLLRRTLHEAGVERIRVVLSHWHVDHVAGNEVFQDCEIVAHRLTAEALLQHQASLEQGDPPVRPLILPTSTYEGRRDLQVGAIRVQLRHLDVHSLDGTVLYLPERQLLLAGDTLEDPVTYVVEPLRLPVHLKELDRLASWEIARILPNHGALGMIEAGGYGPELIGATRDYVEKLLRVRNEPDLAGQDLQAFARAGFEQGAIHYYPAYEAVHRRNVQAVR